MGGYRDGRRGAEELRASCVLRRASCTMHMAEYPTQRLVKWPPGERYVERPSAGRRRGGDWPVHLRPSQVTSARPGASSSRPLLFSARPVPS